MSFLLFTYRKSHTGFSMVPKLVTLNGSERRKIANILLFTEFGDYAEKQCIIKERYPGFDKKDSN